MGEHSGSWHTRRLDGSWDQLVSISLDAPTY
jgi:hypothetical protein